MELNTKFQKNAEWKNPRAVLYSNETEICSWIFRWGFSNKNLLNALLETVHCASLKTLEKNKIITKTETFRTENRFVFSLTKNGVGVAESRTDDGFEYPELAKEKIITLNYFHDLFVQTLTLIGKKRGIARRFSTPRMSGLSGREGAKIPDVIWYDWEEKAIAIELEITQKYTEKLDSFFGRLIESIDSGQIHECLIIMQSQTGLKNYQAALNRNKIPVFTRKSGDVWRFDRDVEVRLQVRNRIRIIHVSESEMSATVRNLTPSGELKNWLDSYVVVTEGLD